MKKSAYEIIENHPSFKEANWYVKGVAVQVLLAYCDGHEDVEGERNLCFFCHNGVKGKDFISIAALAIPGYNAWNGVRTPKLLVSMFGKKAEYFFGREGSVCIYVRPHKDFWLESAVELKDIAEIDEFSYEYDLKLFKLWWD